MILWGRYNFNSTVIEKTSVLIWTFYLSHLFTPSPCCYNYTVFSLHMYLLLCVFWNMKSPSIILCFSCGRIVLDWELMWKFVVTHPQTIIIRLCGALWHLSDFPTHSFMIFVHTLHSSALLKIKKHQSRQVETSWHNGALEECNWRARCFPQCWWRPNIELKEEWNLD